MSAGGGPASRDQEIRDQTFVFARRAAIIPQSVVVMVTISIDERTLGEIVRRLVEAIDPDRIVLFGSRARGDSGPDSDLDLLIVKESDELRHRRAIPAYKALSGLGIPTDIICRTPAEIAEWSRVPNHVITRAIREGKVLYERAA